MRKRKERVFLCHRPCKKQTPKPNAQSKHPTPTLKKQTPATPAKAQAALINVSLNDRKENEGKEGKQTSQTKYRNPIMYPQEIEELINDHHKAKNVEKEKRKRINASFRSSPIVTHHP